MLPLPVFFYRNFFQGQLKSAIEEYEVCIRMRIRQVLFYPVIIQEIILLPTTRLNRARESPKFPMLKGVFPCSGNPA